MKRKLKYFDMEDLESKQFSCFVCTEKSKEKGISLLQSQTAFSRISLGEKLQEILGTKYVVLVTSRDSICWDCASYINWVDRCEHKVDLVKEYIVNQVSLKYRKIEVTLQETVENSEAIQEAVPNLKPSTPPLPPAVIPVQHTETKEIKEDTPPKARKKKEYSCKYCGKGYVSLMSLSMHIQRLHGGKEVCEDCGARFETLALLKRHMKSHIPADKQLTCVSCGFHTTNTEVYCRHVCNSSIVSLTCVTCNKRYVDSNFKNDSSSGTYQCQSCATDETRIEEDQPPQEENTGAELATEMPEFFKDPENNNDVRNLERSEEECVSYLRCEGCEEQFKLGDLTKHLCFIRGDTVEFVEVEAPTFQGKKSQPTSVPLYCKDCGDEFVNIEDLRNHWDHTGHLRQVSTTGVELNKIRDKYKKTEATFKVVKQNFNIRAIIPGQNEEALRSADDYKDMFVKVSKNTTSIDDFARKEGKECETCGFVFATKELLKEHQQMDCLTCVTCSVSFYDNRLLKRHYLYTGHANRIIQSPQLAQDNKGPMGFKCHRCVKTFQSRFLLKKHFQVHYRGTNKGACQFCLLEFENKNDIQQHVLEAHGAHLYKCSHCDRTFMSETFRNRHEAKHKGPFECQICNIKFISKKSLLLHNETYHQGESGSCTLCGKVFEDPLALRKHERRHYFEKQLDCDVCKKRFRNKALLIAHLKTHGDKIKAKCDVCQLGFTTEEALKEHKFSHMKPGRYKCPRCNVSFANKANFWMHTKTHEACYVCTVCNRSFRDTSLLAVHRRKHWRVRPYQCPHCPRTFSVPATLRRHLHVHTRIYPHKCGLCKRGFLTRHAYHRHTETVHGVSHNFPQRRPNIPSLPLNATDEDIFQAADTLIADDSLMFNDYQNKEIEQASSADLITNEVVVETTELFDEILH